MPQMKALFFICGIAVCIGVIRVYVPLERMKGGRAAANQTAGYAMLRRRDGVVEKSLHSSWMYCLRSELKAQKGYLSII